MLCHGLTDFKFGLFSIFNRIYFKHFLNDYIFRSLINLSRFGQMPLYSIKTTICMKPLLCHLAIFHVCKKKNYQRHLLIHKIGLTQETKTRSPFGNIERLLSRKSDSYVVWLYTVCVSLPGLPFLMSGQKQVEKTVEKKCIL